MRVHRVGVCLWRLVTEPVPGLVHLFLPGIGNSIFTPYTTIQYHHYHSHLPLQLSLILRVFALVKCPSSPFQTPFPDLIWYLTQQVHPRRYQV